MRVEAEKLEDEFWQDLEKYRISESKTVLQSQPESWVEFFMIQLASNACFFFFFFNFVAGDFLVKKNGVSSKWFQSFDAKGLKPHWIVWKGGTLGWWFWWCESSSMESGQDDFINSDVVDRFVSSLIWGTLKLDHFDTLIHESKLSSVLRNAPLMSWGTP